MDRDAAIALALEENDVDAVYATTLRRMLDSAERSWECCGGGCDPCVFALQRCVERIEELLTTQEGRSQTKPST